MSTQRPHSSSTVSRRTINKLDAEWPLQGLPKRLHSFDWLKDRSVKPKTGKVAVSQSRKIFLFIFFYFFQLAIRFRKKYIKKQIKYKNQEKNKFPKQNENMPDGMSKNVIKNKNKQCFGSFLMSSSRYWNKYRSSSFGKTKYCTVFCFFFSAIHIVIRLISGLPSPRPSS